MSWKKSRGRCYYICSGKFWFPLVWLINGQRVIMLT